MKKALLLLSALPALCLSSCARSFHLSLYEFGLLNEAPFGESWHENFYTLGEYDDIDTADKGMIPAQLESIYGLGYRRSVIPSHGEPYLTVIPVSFSDYEHGLSDSDVHDHLAQAFFGDSSFNQYVSLAEYYDRSSFSYLQVHGEVTSAPFQSPDTYASLKNKNNASQTKSALTRLYQAAITWYNDLSTGRTLNSGDPVYFVYLAPYSGMDGGSSSRSSMMWAFTINDPAPICWSSYYMMHPREDGAVDAHTYIHEFGHMLGLKDYYDTNSFLELSPCSPLGRADMMDCSLGDHNVFSKILLDWTHPWIADGDCRITLRQNQGNGDCLLIPVSSYSGNPYDEYLLLEYYVPTQLNYADSALRDDPTMSLMKRSGVKVYHVDARLGVYDDRAKSPVRVFEAGQNLGKNSLDLYCENTGSVKAGYAESSRGFLIRSLTVSEPGKLIENFIASDHDEDRNVNGSVARLRNVLFQAGDGVTDPSTLRFHKDETPLYGFEVESVRPSEAVVRVFKA